MVEVEVEVEAVGEVVVEVEAEVEEEEGEVEAEGEEEAEEEVRHCCHLFHFVFMSCPLLIFRCFHLAHDTIDNDLMKLLDEAKNGLQRG